MADKIEKEAKQKPVKAKKEKKKRSNPIKDMVHELKKVTWPSRQELKNYSIGVFVFVVVMAIVTGVMDYGVSKLLSLLTDNFAALFQ
ncbi:MAG TPA: preprotein translocase subunit SecE [Firmicutes bacterium]|nr:preprotein translocase subunit SecE [Bacillota bacterium]